MSSHLDACPAFARRSNLRLTLALAATIALGAVTPIHAAEQQAPASAAGQSTPDPKSKEIPGPIKAEPSDVNFGIVEPGSTVSTTIKISNPLNEDVMILAAKPSCTCTTVDMAGKVIPAGGSIEMPMSMKTSQTPGTKTAVVNMAFKGLGQVMVLKIDAAEALEGSYKRRQTLEALFFLIIAVIVLIVATVWWRASSKRSALLSGHFQRLAAKA
jgi:hypothetical protein